MSGKNINLYSSLLPFLLVLGVIVALFYLKIQIDKGQAVLGISTFTQQTLQAK